MRRIALPVAAVLFALIAACDPAPPAGTGRACAASTECTAPQMCIDGHCKLATDGGRLDHDGGLPTDAPARTLQGVHVEPATMMLTATDGATPTVDFALMADWSDGSSSELTNAVWTATAPVIGTVNRTTGVFMAGGIVGGTATVTASASSMMATGTVTVRIERNVIDTGALSDAAAHFGAGIMTVDDTTRAATLAYPLDHTVFPQNVYPADVQWSGGVETDLYQVRLDAPGVQVRAYVIHTGAAFGFHWLPTPPAWRALAESATEIDVSVAIDRWEASTNTVITGHPVHVRFANATIRGAIYYWDLGLGRIQRINGDGTGRVSFMPNPPSQPTNSANRCVACHAISRDGRRMAAELWDASDTSAIFDLTGDTTADPPPTIVAPGTVSFLTASFSPDNNRLIASAGNALFLIDGNTGARISTTLPTASTSQPEWSPDGAQIAYVATANGTTGWAIDFTHGELGVIDVMAGDTFGTPRTIFSATGAPVIARPSWAPSSAFIAFQHGQHSRSFLDPGGPTDRQPARVEMVTRDGATPYALDNLNGGATASSSYYPTFSPFDEGGYFWLAFFSTRDYGNAQVGTAGTSRRQLWVAAVSDTPVPGTDPSFSPYWLPQQNVADQNMAAFWTESACHMDGLSCATSGECCSGFCRDNGSGAVCVPPDMVECSHDGEACAGNGDCCTADMTTCMGNRCTSLM